MNRRLFSRSFTLAVPTLLVCTLLAACAGSTPPAEDPNAHPDPAASSAAADPNAPCGPNDCTPCDETKQKCMGPMVCDNHPELASRKCKRDTDGTCKDMIVCANAP